MPPKTIQKVCRVCLDVDPPLPLHSLADRDVRSLFEECTSVKIRLGDNNPNQLCEQCFLNCLNWHSFKSRAVAADQKLKRSRKTKLTPVPRMMVIQATIVQEPDPISDIEFYRETPDDDEPVKQEPPDDESMGEGTSVADDVPPQKKRIRSNKPSVCEYCGMVFCAATLAYHIKTKHVGTTLFACKLCDKTFVQKNNLLIHEKRHSGQKDFHCGICGKGYFRKFDLTEHIQMAHGKEARFPCDQCDAGFYFKGQLITHQRIHTGERPYKCDQCEKQFTVRGRLLRHQKVHTGEKPFVCGVCGFACNRAENLRLHEKIHNK